VCVEQGKLEIQVGPATERKQREMGAQTTGRVFPLRAEMEAVMAEKASRRPRKKKTATKSVVEARADERRKLQERALEMEASIEQERLTRERLQAELAVLQRAPAR
jgi:hypothetical protein